MSDRTEIWKLLPHEVARRVEVADLPGFLGKDLPVEAGTRAAFYENERFVGELGPGVHPVRSTFQTLFFWSPTHCSALIVRQGDQPLEFPKCRSFTSDLLEVETGVHVTARIADLGLFHVNLMRGRMELVDRELRMLVEPLVVQAASEAVGRLSLKDLVGPEARANLDAMIGQSLRVLGRYGLEFVGVRTMSICHPEYDAHRRRSGELWLARERMTNTDAELKLEIDRRLARLRHDEELGDLENLARDVATDHAEGRLANLRRRITVRKEMRGALQANQFDQIRSAAEMQNFLRQRDAEQVLAQAEQQQLIATIADQKTDRETQRQHLLERLKMEQQVDLLELKGELAHRERMKRLGSESEFARRNASEQSLQFQEELTRTTREQEARHASEQRELEHLRVTLRGRGELRRTEEWEDTLQRQRVLQAEAEIALQTRQRERQIQLIDIEVQAARGQAQADLQQRRLLVWKNIRMVKQSALQQESDNQLRETRARQEHDLETLKAKSQLSAEQLLALSSPADAAAVLQEQARRQAAALAHENTHRLQQQLNDAIQQRDAGAVAALQQALQVAQANFQHLGGLMDTVTRNLAPKDGTTVVVPGVGVFPTGVSDSAANAPKVPERVLLCQSCRTEIRPENRFCPQCGKPV